MLSAAKHASIASRGMSYDRLTAEENVRAWLTDASTCFAGTTQTVHRCSITTPGTALKDAGEGKSSQWAELWAVYVVAHFCLEGEMARAMMVY